MKKHYFLGLAAGIKHPFRHLFIHGSKKDLTELTKYLSQRYGGEAMLCKNGRSALALALKAYLNPGDSVIVNGFTCYAVYEAVKAAGMRPVFADISKEDLNFTTKSLEKVIDGNVKGIIVQNSLGNPVNIEEIERFARVHGLVIIEDLAHSAGLKYAEKCEAGTIGVASVFSFGKEKSIDTVSGGAVVFRGVRQHIIGAPSKIPHFADYTRERWYPVFGLWCRRLTRVRLGGPLMRLLMKLHFVERSADNRLDLERRPACFEAKLALRKLKSLRPSHERRLREFYLVNDRECVLRELKKAGYYFDGFWYEKPVSPERYYQKVHFDEKTHPVAVEACRKIVNLPNYYSEAELAPAREIIKRHLAREEKHGE